MSLKPHKSNFFKIWEKFSLEVENSGEHHPVTITDSRGLDTTCTTGTRSVELAITRLSTSGSHRLEKDFLFCLLFFSFLR